MDFEDMLLFEEDENEIQTELSLEESIPRDVEGHPFCGEAKFEELEWDEEDGTDCRSGVGSDTGGITGAEDSISTSTRSPEITSSSRVNSQSYSSSNPSQSRSQTKAQSPSQSPSQSQHSKTASTKNELSQLFDSFNSIRQVKRAPPSSLLDQRRTKKKLSGTFSTSTPSANSAMHSRFSPSSAHNMSSSAFKARSQQEMFGFAPGVTLSRARIPLDAASEPEIQSSIVQETMEEEVEMENAEEAQEEEAEMSIPEVQEAVFHLAPDPPERVYYQMSSIDTSLNPEERRIAIIHTLELFALSILQQFFDSSINTPIPIVAMLAKRTTKSDIEIMKPLKLPAARGGCCGSKEFAILLQVIESVLNAVREKVFVTKRDIYYTNVELFGRQTVVDTVIEDLAATLRVRRSELKVVAAGKGLFSGSIEIIGLDGVARSGGTQGALIPPIDTIDRIITPEISWILVVEKEAVFRTLCSPEFLENTKIGSGILITGKGYPDLSTRELIKYLSDNLPSAPILALLDSDPHGLQILSTYVHGSLSMKYDQENLAVPRIKWIGVKATEWDALGVGREHLLPLTGKERKLAIGMLENRDWNEDWKRELSYMIHLGKKAEIQVISSLPRSLKPFNDQDSPRYLDSSSNVEFRNPLIDYVVEKIFSQL